MVTAECLPTLQPETETQKPPLVTLDWGSFTDYIGWDSQNGGASLRPIYSLSYQEMEEIDAGVD